MAYLRTVTRECYADGCTAPAVVEVIGRLNESYGIYCKPHGERYLRERKAREADEDAAKHRTAG